MGKKKQPLPNIHNLIMAGIVAMLLFCLATHYQSFSGSDKLFINPDKELEIISSSPIQGLDPVQADHPCLNKAVANVYEGLVTYDSLEPLKLIPCLAKEMPHISDDGLVYTFKVRDWIRFHDNLAFSLFNPSRKIEAADFVYSIKRIADPATQTPYWGLLANRIQGLDGWRKAMQDKKGVDYKTVVPGIKALDKSTVQFTLNMPWDSFLNVLAMPLCAVVPHEAVTYHGKDFGRYPSGTGPFSVSKISPDMKEIVFNNNGIYRSLPSKNPLFLERITTRVIPRGRQCWEAFQKIKGDMLCVASLANVVPSVVTNNQNISTLTSTNIPYEHKKYYIATHYFAFNCEQLPFKDNVKLRQAMSMAFDSKRYIAQFFPHTGVAPVGMLPPGYSSYTTPYGYNLAKAKALLVEAGYPNGQGLPIILLDTLVGEVARKQAEFFAASMKKIGIKVRVIANMLPVLKEKMNNKATMMHATSFQPGYPGCEPWLAVFRDTTGRLGNTCWQNETYNKLYDRAMHLPKGDERDALYQQLNKLAIVEAPVIYALHAYTHLVMRHSWIKNYLQLPFRYNHLQYVTINATEKKEGKEQAGIKEAKEAQQKKELEEKRLAEVEQLAQIERDEQERIRQAYELADEERKRNKKWFP